MANIVPVNKLVQDPKVKKRFEDVMKNKAPSFLASVASAVSTNNSLQKCEPMSVLGAAMIAATLDLPINSNLGFAHIVPYKKGKTGVYEGQFQMGWRGYVQLAERTGQYETINASIVYKDELKSYNRHTGILTLTPESEWKMADEGKQKDIVGYQAFLQLTNGFKKTVYKTVAQTEAHAKKYSSQYRMYSNGLWKDNFNAMALKTVIKELIKNWGIMSIETMQAVNYDQGTVKLGKEDEVEYVDNEVVDVEPSSVEDIAGDIFSDDDKSTSKK